MSKEKNLNYKLFTAAAIATSLLGIAILLLSFYIGRNEFFLLLNTDLGPAADIFFRYFTYAGDGWWWILWLLIFLRKRSQLLPLLFSSFFFTTLFIQVCKQVILPDVYRPVLAIEAQEQVHYVIGVIVHTTNTFPSGHTATAFTFLLLVALLVQRALPIIIVAVAALLVGYSRVYLGQHFPLDVGAGMIVAACSVFLGVLVQKSVIKKGSFRMRRSAVRQRYDTVPS
jgi:membrane-associated phospholipid phosphatase